MEKPQPDLQVLALTKAIRANEGGNNYKAIGDAGTSTGAYQYQPDTWRAFSKQILGTDNAPMTPENQNAVTYGMVKTWKDSGMGPAEIAAKWNSGSNKGWENKIGVTTINGQQIPYNTPKYVQNVVGHFKDIYPQLQQQYGDVSQVNAKNTSQPEATDNQSILSKIGNFFTSGTQTFGNTIGNAIEAPKNAQLYANAAKQYSDLTENLNNAIKDKVSKGEDPSNLQIALRQHLQSAPSLQDFTGDVINKSNEQVLGEAGQFGLELTSGGILSGGAKAAASKEASILSRIGTGAKIGATYGGLGGAFNAMSNNQSAGNVLGEATAGGVTGAALGGVLEGAGIVANKAIGAVAHSGIVNKILPETDAKINRQMGWVKNAQDEVAKAYKDALPLTPTQQIKEQGLLNKTGDNVYTTLAKYNINAGSDQALSQLQEVSDKFSNAVNHAKDNEYGLFNLNEMKNRADAEVNQNLSSETARIAAKNKISAEIDALAKANKKSIFTGPKGESMVDSSFMERLRDTGNSWTPFNASDPEKVGQSAGWALANAVRDQVEKEGTFPGYRNANREWSKVLHAREVLQKISDSGKTFRVVGGLGGSIARKVLSGVFGFHTAGVAGTILSEIGSEYAAKILSNPEWKTYFDRKLLERFGNGQKATPKAVFELENEVKNFLDKQSNLQKLPSGSTIFTGSPTDVSGIDKSGTQAMNQYYANRSRINTLQLPAGNPNIVNGPTMKLRAPSSIESQAATVNYSNSKSKPSIVSLIEKSQMKQSEKEAVIKFINESYLPDNKLPIIQSGTVPKKASNLPTIKL